MGNPVTANVLHRYPEKPLSSSTYVLILLILVLLQIIIDREIFHGRVWHSEEKFLSPMVITSSNKHIFVNDFVTLSLPNLGVTIAKVLKFFQKVSCSIINIRVYIFAAPLGRLLVCIC